MAPPQRDSDRLPPATRRPRVRGAAGAADAPGSEPTPGPTGKQAAELRWVSGEGHTAHGQGALVAGVGQALRFFYCRQVKRRGEGQIVVERIAATSGKALTSPPEAGAPYVSGTLTCLQQKAFCVPAGAHCWNVVLRPFTTRRQSVGERAKSRDKPTTRGGSQSPHLGLGPWWLGESALSTVWPPASGPSPWPLSGGET